MEGHALENYKITATKVHMFKGFFVYILDQISERNKGPNKDANLHKALETEKYEKQFIAHKIALLKCACFLKA